MNRLTLVTPPSIEPLDLASVKNFLRVDSADDDAHITSLIKSSREACEQYTGRALITQTWDLWLNDFPVTQSDEWWNGVRTGSLSELSRYDDHIKLPLPRLQSVTYINIYNDSDVATIMSASSYYVDTSSEPGKIYLRNSASWPAVTRAGNGVQIRFVAGYGNTASSVPAPLLQGMREWIAYSYNQCEGFDYYARVISHWRPYKMVRL